MAPKNNKEISHPILAVDLGTSGCKVTIVDAAGFALGWEFEPVPVQVLPGGGAEQNADDWWSAMVTASKRLLRKMGLKSVDAVVCSAMGECTVPVDEDGKPLMGAMMWMDMRGCADIVESAGGPIRISGYGPMKLWRWLRLTGGAPSLSGKDQAGHMLYIKNHLPHIYGRTYKFLNSLDYLNLRLTGKFITTPDSMLTAWVTDNRDAANVRYDNRLIRQTGLEKSKLPDIAASTEIIGDMLPSVAKALGLKKCPPVVAGSIDTSSAAVGSGAVADKDMHLYIGTSSWLAAHVPYKKTDINAGIASVPCAVPDRYLMIAMQTTGGGNLNFLKERILYHQDELLRDEGASDIYKILDKIAERTPAGSRGLLYTPWLYGERVPVEEPSLRAGLFNLSLEHSREDIIRAFLEGVALNTRWMLKPVEKFLKEAPRRVTIAGGGGNSDVWSQIFADVLGIPVRQLAEPMQANAIGAAAIARVALGQNSFTELAGQTRYRQTYEPSSKNTQIYNRAFDTYTELYRRLRPLYKRLNPASQSTGEAAGAGIGIDSPTDSVISYGQAGENARGIREKMVDTCRLLADQGFLAGVGGNLAVRIDAGRMAVTPSAVDYYTMTWEDICIVTIDSLEQVAGEKEPTTESALHAAMFTAKPDVKVSLHTHQPLASAVALLGIDLQIQGTEALRALGPALKSVPYGPSGTFLLVRALKKSLHENIDGYLLRNHGVICAADSLEHAVDCAGLIEEQCRLFLDTSIEKRSNFDSQMDGQTLRARLLKK